MHIRPLLPLAYVVVLAAVGVAARGAVSAPARTGGSVTPLPRQPVDAQLAFTVRDADTGGLIPAKLTLLGAAGTPDPRFTRNDIGKQEGDGTVLAHNRIFTITGSGSAHVPAGTYDVYVSRGPEWDLFVQRGLRLQPPGAAIEVRLKHVVDTAGWLSADFHVHAALSSDSQVPMHDRVYEFVADGVDLITSTDHNVVADYAPIIAELGVGRYLTSITGDELTTGGWGHFGAFPLPRDLEKAGHGAVLVHGRNAHDFFADVRTHAPEAVIDVHHPRLDAEIGYFNLAGFDARADRANKNGFSYDFDAVEVLNGYQDSERRSVDRVIDDWFALLEHGHIVTATGNSDTHHLDHNLGGYPRNYVRVLDDAPAKVTPTQVARAVKGHHVLFTTAPFVTLSVSGESGGAAGGIGDVVAARGGKARASIEVRAAPWVSVTTLTVYVDGKELRRFPVPASTEVVRIRQTVDLAVTRDAWVVVRVDGNQPLAPVVGDRVHFDVRPLALTNPVFLDVDGNGAYDPPEKHGPHAPK